MNWTQQDAPLMDALKEHLMNRVVRFDVPGHKGGRGNHELADFLGERCVQIDVNSMKNLDNLCHPVSVLRDAQQLAAEAFGAANAFFIINGNRCIPGNDYVCLQSWRKIDYAPKCTPQCHQCVSCKWCGSGLCGSGRK